eukprot:scaffold21419_cov20-Tisochrysis_lutea.AAC.1
MEHAHAMINLANALYIRKEFDEAKVRDTLIHLSVWIVRWGLFACYAVCVTLDIPAATLLLNVLGMRCLVALWQHLQLFSTCGQKQRPKACRDPRTPLSRQAQGSCWRLLSLSAAYEQSLEVFELVEDADKVSKVLINLSNMCEMQASVVGKCGVVGIEDVARGYWRTGHVRGMPTPTSHAALQRATSLQCSNGQACAGSHDACPSFRAQIKTVVARRQAAEYRTRLATFMAGQGLKAPDSSCPVCSTPQALQVRLRISRQQSQDRGKKDWLCIPMDGNAECPPSHMEPTKDDDKELVVLSCAHSLHNKCWESWVAEKSQAGKDICCPTCSE